MTGHLRELTQEEETGCIWLAVVEVAAHSWLVHYFWPCGEIALHGGSLWQKKLLTSWQMAGTRGEEDGLWPSVPFKGTPRDPPPSSEPLPL